MKTIDVLVKGKGAFLACYSAEDEDVVSFSDLEYECLNLIEPETVEADGTVYEKEDDDGYTWGSLYNNLWTEALRYYEFPISLWAVETREETCSFKLELADDEEFDIHKLKFIYSWEFRMFEDFALNTIWYDGQLIDESANGDRYCNPLLDKRAEGWRVEEFDDVWPEDNPDYIKLPWQMNREED